MSGDKLRYGDFARDIDVDDFMADIGFEPLSQERGFENGHCPDPWGLHKNGDTSGKFGIHRDGRTFSCFVCGGGNLLSLTMAIKDCDEEEAIDYLYRFTKPVEESNEEFIDEIDQILAVAKRERPVWPYFNEHVLDKYDAWEEVLAWNRGEYDLDAFGNPRPRGISEEVLIRYRIGGDPAHVRKSKSKGQHTGPGIIFPHFWQSKLVGWQVRWHQDRPKWVPKYTNTHDFPREKTLFNYEQVYFSADPIVVVESVPTVLFLASLGIPAVATFGSNVSDEQIRLLRKCQQGLVLAPDNDPAGRKWTVNSRSDAVPLAESLSRYVTVRVTKPIPGEGGDLGDLVGQESLLRGVIRIAEYYYPASI